MFIILIFCLVSITSCKLFSQRKKKVQKNSPSSFFRCLDGITWTLHKRKKASSTDNFHHMFPLLFNSKGPNQSLYLLQRSLNSFLQFFSFFSFNGCFSMPMAGPGGGVPVILTQVLGTNYPNSSLSTPSSEFTYPDVQKNPGFANVSIFEFSLIF